MPGSRRARLAGSVHFHPTGEPHSGRVGERGLVSVSLIPLGRLALRLDARPPREDRLPRLDGLAAECHAMLAEAPDDHDLQLEERCLEMARLALQIEEPRPERGASHWLELVRDFLHAHASRPVGLAELAEIAGVHETHLARTFRQRIGCSPGAYLRRLRVERARRLLIASRAPLVCIALEVGFCSQSHFTRVFHALVGTTPAAFRRRHSFGRIRRDSGRGR